MVGKTLEDLLADEDDLRLLDVKPLAQVGTEATRVGQQFRELNGFVDKHGFAPGAGPAGRKVSVPERALQMRLKAYLTTPGIRQSLLPMDRHGLLAASPTPVVANPQTLDEILDLDDDLLVTPAEDIFAFRHARPAGVARPDKISERKRCLDFDKFKPMFDACATELASKARKTMPFAKEMEIGGGASSSSCTASSFSWPRSTTRISAMASETLAYV